MPPEEDNTTRAICIVCRVDTSDVMTSRDFMRQKNWNAAKANLKVYLLNGCIVSPITPGQRTPIRTITIIRAYSLNYRISGIGLSSPFFHDIFQ